MGGRLAGGASASVSASSILKRSDSLTKREKQTANERRKELEAGQRNKLGGNGNNKEAEEEEEEVADLVDLDSLAKSTSGTAAKILKTLANQRKIRRRHTVGGTKDFAKDLAMAMTTLGQQQECNAQSPSPKRDPCFSSPAPTPLSAARRSSPDLLQTSILDVDSRRLSLPEPATSGSPTAVMQPQQQAATKRLMPSLLESQV